LEHQILSHFHNGIKLILRQLLALKIRNIQYIGSFADYEADMFAHDVFLF
jgi:hypothetical protein